MTVEDIECKNLLLQDINNEIRKGMNMKKSTIFMALGLSTMLLATGCKKDSTEDYSSYVTLGEYKGIEVSVDYTEITEEDITNKVNADLAGTAETVEITDRAVEDGDTATIDYEGSIDGEVFEGGTATDYALVIGSGSFIDGFEDQLIGANIGDEVEVNVTFPEEYSNNPDLAGKDAKFDVVIKKISIKETPELTKEWVTENTEYKTVEEYKEGVKAELEAAALENDLNNKTALVLDKIVENSSITGYPQEEIDAYVAQMDAQIDYYASIFGDRATVFASLGTTEEEFKADSLESAQNIIGRQMICKLIAEKENFTLSDEEYSEKALVLAGEYGINTVEDFEAQYGKDVIYETILIEKVLGFITEESVEV